ncbi:MAG: DUF4325 domain-containing protein [Proteobacteria bacterium]|nr:MAG: DUF4325 domain-containing protein [Pseudomonadota bacterium]
MSATPSLPLDQIEAYIVANLYLHSRDIVAVTMREFEVTRPTVIARINSLIEKKKISKSGSRNKVVYQLLDNKIVHYWIEPIGKEGDENRIWEQRFEPLTTSLQPNVRDILRYSVSEMINNVIDHSEGTEIGLSFEETETDIKILVMDDGVGIFNKISKALALHDQREAVLHLSKGKFTTDSANHSGQGIFFTSRAVDEFSILSSGLSYMRYRKERDWLMESSRQVAGGTRVLLEIKKDSDSDLTAIFKKYSDEEDPGFNKTHVYVAMAKLAEEEYVSRSQARRLLLGLDKFEEFVLDFANVRSVGQGFVDEVFRVFKERHPKIKIRFTNANSDVEFMIKRGLPNDSNRIGS